MSAIVSANVNYFKEHFIASLCQSIWISFCNRLPARSPFQLRLMLGVQEYSAQSTAELGPCWILIAVSNFM